MNNGAPSQTKSSGHPHAHQRRSASPGAGGCNWQLLVFSLLIEGARREEKHSGRYGSKWLKVTVGIAVAMLRPLC
jgi:hypothetical protein